jgi:hypothetical protein
MNGKCPQLAHSGCAGALQCPLSEVKRTFFAARMSAFDPKRTLGHPLLVADEVFGSEANAPYAGPILLGPCAKGDSDEGVKK